MAKLPRNLLMKLHDDLHPENLPLQIFVAYLCGVGMSTSTHLAAGVDEK
jgi:hypothetical protein